MGKKNRYVGVTVKIRNLLLYSLKDLVMQVNKFSTDNECMADGN